MLIRGCVFIMLNMVHLNLPSYKHHILCLLVHQNLGEFLEDLELDFKLFFFADSGSAYIVLGKSK